MEIRDDVLEIIESYIQGITDPRKTVDNILTLLTKHGYLDGNAQITAEFDCPDCGGTGCNKYDAYQCEGCTDGKGCDDESKSDCPTCNGKDKVVKGLWTWRKCKYDPCAEEDCSYGFYGTRESACTPDRDIRVPVTPSTMPHDLKGLEWREVEK